MREDPIIYQDWRIGNTQSGISKLIPHINFIVSFIYVALNISLEIGSRNYFALLFWMFILVILVFVEIIIDQSSRSIFDRVIIVFGLYLPPLLLETIRLIDSVTIEMVFILLLVLKISLVPIAVSNDKLTGEILLPNTQNVEFVLKEHIARLEETSYEFDVDEELQKSVAGSLRSSTFYLFGGFIISILIWTITRLLNETIGFYFVFTVIVISGLGYAGVTYIWYFLRRFNKTRNNE